MSFQMPLSDIALSDLVKNLVIIDYIQDRNCINLRTLPMTDDPSNSNASVLHQACQS